MTFTDYHMGLQKFGIVLDLFSKVNFLSQQKVTVKSKTKNNLELIFDQISIPRWPLSSISTTEVTLMYVNLKALLHT